jgi:murein DD-endopeptidase MepM/ murein hydrolase activator NlpD
MQIILVSNRLTNTRSMTLSMPHLLLAGAVLIAVSLSLTAGLLYVSLRYAADLKLPYIEPIVAAAQEHEARRMESYMRDNLNAMAVKLGQMQAQLVRLDALGERLATLSGIKPSEFRFNEPPARGGAIPAGLPVKSLSLPDFQEQLEQVSRHMENRSDTLGILEAQLFEAKVRQKLMPTMIPVEASWSASSFGWRIDPITGMQAMHEGVDFIADSRTPIVAAAGGIVTAAEFHHQYGNLVEIDHGNDFTTRYAHASRLLVKPGDVVQRGRKIAEVGATGRATGPHLHFEVRYKGVAQNPTRFLQAAR